MPDQTPSSRSVLPFHTRTSQALPTSQTPFSYPCSNSTKSACFLRESVPLSLVQEWQVMALVNPEGFKILIRQGRRLMEAYYALHPEDRPSQDEGPTSRCR